MSTFPPAPPPNEFSSPEEREEIYNIQRMHAPIMREQDDPRDGFEPIHPALTILFGALVFWGGYYLSTFAGGFRTDVYDESKPLGVAEAPKQLDPKVLGQRLYSGKCIACHQPDGRGRPGQFPPLAGSELVAGDPALLARILLNGLQGDVTVAGQKFNGNMPAFGEQLKDEQIAAVLTHIRQEWGNSGDEMPVELVAAARKADAARKQPWTITELQAAPPVKVEPPAKPEPLPKK